MRLLVPLLFCASLIPGIAAKPPAPGGNPCTVHQKLPKDFWCRSLATQLGLTLDQLTTFNPDLPCLQWDREPNSYCVAQGGKSTLEGNIQR